MPALLTSTSTRPNSSIAASTRAWHASGEATSVATLEGPAAGGLHERGGVAEPLDPTRAERDVGPGLGEPLREGDAEPRGGAGDDGDLAVEGEQVGDR